MRSINQKGFSFIRFAKLLFIGLIILGVLFFIAFKIYQKWEYAAIEASSRAYIDGASNAIISHMMSNYKLKLNNTCEVYDDKIKCSVDNSLEQILLSVDIKGNLPTSGVITFTDDWSVSEAELIMKYDNNLNFLKKKYKVICKKTACHIE